MILSKEMIRRILILTACTLIGIAYASAQQTPLKREVTLYNPYKPSLNEAKKMNFMPDMTDTAKFRPSFSYNVTTTPFMPVYTVSPIKAATLQPDPLDKLYRSYVNLGFGSYTSPLAEISITNERSKKGALGFYGRHYSNNGNIALDNGQKVYAGRMDNDLSLFGKKFFRGVVVGGSVDYLQRMRHAYGYNPDIFTYHPDRKATKINYADVGAALSVSSTTLDSSRFAYDFNLSYDYFYNNRDISQRRFRFDGEMAKVFRGFFVGAGVEFRHFQVPVAVGPFLKYVAAVNPFVQKSTSQWQFKLGMQALLERNIEPSTKLHVYPDLGFGFSIVPSYVNFFTSLTGGLQVNDALAVCEENPFFNPFGLSLYLVPSTDKPIVASAGLRGNTGLGGTYELSASYSLVNNMIFYTNLLTPADTVYGRGNYFSALTDDVDILTIHGGMTGNLTDKMSFNSSVNYYKYTMSALEHPFNMPSWDASLGLKYNLRDKIIAGMELTLLGDRKLVATNPSEFGPLRSFVTTSPWHPNLNLSAEYRYSKILSFWAKFNNLSHERYYEWAYYPTYRFMFMLGFTYSL
ncbi:MAG TPA: hypothetical protein VK207_05130 [Bacteroidales bacterium]|nr:hypothetical protein [Bacteroidales bacterium]